jgi:hypothetical protein
MKRLIIGAAIGAALLAGSAAVAVAQEVEPGMIEVITTDPGIIQSVRDGVVILVGALFSVLTIMVTRYAPAAIKAFIDDKLMKFLHQAVMTWAEDAMKDGVGPASGNLVTSVRKHLDASIPGTMALLRPGVDVLERLAKRYLSEVGDRKVMAMAALQQVQNRSTPSGLPDQGRLGL